MGSTTEKKPITRVELAATFSDSLEGYELRIATSGAATQSCKYCICRRISINFIYSDLKIRRMTTGTSGHGSDVYDSTPYA